MAEKLNPPESEVETFYYEGNDMWIDFKKKETPPCPKQFVARIRLKSGEVMNAPPSWRRKIWKWWYESRRVEIFRNATLGMARQLAPPRRLGRVGRMSGRLPRGMR
jgi:hypothetical protein